MKRRQYNSNKTAPDCEHYICHGELCFTERVNQRNKYGKRRSNKGNGNSDNATHKKRQSHGNENKRNMEHSKFVAYCFNRTAALHHSFEDKNSYHHVYHAAYMRISKKVSYLGFTEVIFMPDPAYRHAESYDKPRLFRYRKIR